MNQDFSVIERIISSRRTVKPNRMNGEKVPDELVQALLQLADWAPTHKRTEPWRFMVFEGQHLQDFAERHIAVYREHCPPEKFNEITCFKIKLKAEKASHLVVAVMQRSANKKIVRDEEYAAVAAAVQNLLLGAAALGIAAIWDTGGRAASAEMKTLLGLEQEDEVVSFVYLGYTDDQEIKGVRRIPVSDKTTWNKRL